jgi:hypothetical protein
VGVLLEERVEDCRLKDVFLAPFVDDDDNDTESGLGLPWSSAVAFRCDEDMVNALTILSV